MALIFLIFLAFPIICRGECFQYNGTVCSSTIKGQVWAPSLSIFLSAVANSTSDEKNANLLLLLAPECYYAFMNFTCGVYFPRCDAKGSPVSICPAVCSASHAQCYQLFKMAGHQADLTTCEIGSPMKGTSRGFFYSDTASCFNTTGNMNVGLCTEEPISCPTPLIPSPFGQAESANIINCPYSRNCQYCCLPCPMYRVMYPKNAASNVEISTGSIDLISAFLLLIVFVLLGSQPTTSKDPRTQTVMFSVANAFCMCLIDGIFIAFFRQEYMCENAVESNTGRLTLCATEGFFYGWFGFVFTWSNVILDINIMRALFHKEMMPRHVLYTCFFVVQTIGFILSIVVYTQKVTHYFGVQCSSEDLPMYRDTLINPIVAGLITNIFTASINNTTIGILGLRLFFRKTRTEHSGNTTDISSEEDLLKKSWRPALLSLLICISFFCFMLWWFLDANPKILALANTNAQNAPAWTKDWLTCIVKYKDQAFCSSIARPHMPNWTAWATISILSSLAGVFYFIAFGLHVKDWQRLYGILERMANLVQHQTRRQLESWENKRSLARRISDSGHIVVANQATGN